MSEVNDLISKYFSKRTRLDLLFILVGICAIYLTSLYNNLFFHSIVELIGAILAVAVFATTWTARRYLDNSFFLVIGIAFLFVGGLNILNVLAYQGMNVFPGFDVDLSILFTIGANFVLGSIFLIAPYFTNRKLNGYYLLTAFTFLSLIFILSIFWWKSFPEITSETMHLTAFAYGSTAIISLMLFLGAIMVIQNRRSFDEDIWKIIFIAQILFIVAGLFTAYDFSRNNLSDKSGHLINLVAIYLIYMSIVRVGVTKPARLLYKNLQDNREQLHRSYERLEFALQEAKAGLWDWDLTSGQLKWSNELYKLFGLPQNQKATFDIWTNILHPDDRKMASDSINQAIANHAPLDNIYRIILPDKQIRWISALGNTTYNESGQAIRMSGMCIDITERKMAEELFGISEMKYRRLFESAKDGILILDFSTGMIIDVNPFLLDLLGYSKKDMTQKHLWDIGLFKDIFTSKKAFLELQTKEFIRYEDLPLETKNGEKMFVEFVSNVYLVNKVKVIQCNIRDITDRKNAEQKTRARQHELETILNTTPASIFYKDAKNHFIRVNKAYADTTGTTQAELEGKSLFDLYPIEQANAFWKDDLEVIKSGKPKMGIIEPVQTNNKIFWFQTDKIPFFNEQNQIIGVIGFAVDITKQKLREKRIQKLSSLYSILSLVNEAIVRTRDKKILFSETCKIIANEGGFPLVWIGEVQDKKVIPITSSGQATGYLDHISIETEGEKGQGPTGTSIRENKPIVNENFNQNPLTSPWRLQAQHYGFRASASIPLRMNGQPIGALTLYSLEPNAFDEEQIKLLGSLGSDISYALDAINEEEQRKQVEEENVLYARQLELDKAEDEALLSNIADAIVAVDLQGQIVFTNRAFRELVQLNENELTGQVFEKTVNVCNAGGDILSFNDRPIGQAMKTGQTVTSGTAVTSDLFLSRLDGKKIPLLITAAPIILNGKITGGIAVWHDITKEKEIDQAKNEFVSLASHQLRTPLAGISLSSELLLRGVGGDIDPKQKRYLEEIFESTKRMSNIIKSLLDVSRIELGTFKINPGPTDITRNVDQIIQDLIRQINGKNLTLQRDYEPGLPIINFDQNVLRIITENLITNAINYTPQTGVINVMIRKEDDNIILSVSDTGYGIPADQHHKIFEKSFRASNIKDSHPEGTGLGLYIIKKVLEKINSRIWFESTEGKGTTFHVAIPMNTTSDTDLTKNTHPEN